VVLCVQVSLVARLPIGGAQADLLLLLAISAGLAGGPDAGAAVGFAAGLLFDLVLESPLGLSALVYCLVGFAVGALRPLDPGRFGWRRPATLAVASAAGTLGYALGDQILGQHPLAGPPLATILVVVAVANVTLGPLATRALAWALASRSEHAVPAR
jgi:rod shape-determining protein MreD